MIQSELWQIARRQWIPFLAVFSFGIATTIAVVLFAPRRFQSEAMLLLKVGRENVSLDPTVTTTGETVNLYRTREGEINTALQAMTSRSIFEQVVDQLGESAVLRGSLETGSGSGSPIGWLKDFVGSILAEIDPIEDRERAIIELQSGLKIRAEKNSSVVNVRYTTKSAGFAQQVATAWIDVYRAEHARVNATLGSLEFFQKQEGELLALLEKVRDEFQSRKSEFGVVTVDGGQETLESQLQWAKSSLIQNKAKLAGARARLTAMEGFRRSTMEKIVTSEATSNTNEAQNRMRDRLYALELEEGKLAASLTKDHPAYIAVVQQLDEARSIFRAQQDASSQVIEGVNPLHISMTELWTTEVANADALDAEVKSTEAMLVQLLEDSTSMNKKEMQLAAMQRHVDILESQYRTLVDKREQARLGAELEAHRISSINVVQSPSLENRPVTPNKKLCSILGLLGSLLAAAGCATLREAKRPVERRSRSAELENRHQAESPSETDSEIHSPLVGSGKIRAPLFPR